jgi:hypothetical protein
VERARKQGGVEDDQCCCGCRRGREDRVEDAAEFWGRMRAEGDEEYGEMRPTGKVVERTENLRLLSAVTSKSEGEDRW